MRLAGVRAASAPLIALTEDFCVPSAGWAEALLDAHERELSALLSVIPVAAEAKAASERTNQKAGPKKEKKKPASGGHDRESTTGKIMKLLRDHPKDVFDAAEVARHLGAKVESVRTMLKRLVEAGDIRKTGRGAFRA